MTITLNPLDWLRALSKVQITVTSRGMLHAIGASLAAINILANDQAFLDLLSPGVAKGLHLVVALMPWFAAAGISMVPLKKEDQ